MDNNNNNDNTSLMDGHAQVIADVLDGAGRRHCRCDDASQRRWRRRRTTTTIMEDRIQHRNASGD